MQKLRDHAKTDEAYIQLKETILTTFPVHKNQLPEALRQYWQVYHDLSKEDDLILYGCRLLILTALCKKILTHQGKTHTKRRAQLTLHWPGLDSDIENTITSCTQCQVLNGILTCCDTYCC